MPASAGAAALADRRGSRIRDRLLWQPKGLLPEQFALTGKPVRTRQQVLTVFEQPSERLTSGQPNGQNSRLWGKFPKTSQISSKMLNYPLLVSQITPAPLVAAVTEKLSAVNVPDSARCILITASMSGSGVRPSRPARSARTRAGQPATIAATAGSGTQSISALTAGPAPGLVTTLRPCPALPVPRAEPAIPRSLPARRRRSRRSRWSARSEARTNDLEARQDDGHTRPRGRPEAKDRRSSHSARRAPHKT
jgi:hypothetical protein